MVVAVAKALPAPVIAVVGAVAGPAVVVVAAAPGAGAQDHAAPSWDCPLYLLKEGN